MASYLHSHFSLLFLSLFFFLFVKCYLASQIALGSRIVAGDNQVWLSDNRTFAFGFTPFNSEDEFQLAIWYAELPGDRVIVWSANRNSPVGKDAAVELDNTGNLVLTDNRKVAWASNTSRADVSQAAITDSGNLVLYDKVLRPVWESFSHPFDTLLPGQALTVSSELRSSNSPLYGGYYTLKMLQEPSSLSLGLIYNSPDSNSGPSDVQSNYSYWSGPEISNVTGNLTAVLDEDGNIGIIYGSSSEGIVYVHKNDINNGGSTSGNRSTVSSALRRLTLEMNGNLRLYRWDNDVNGSQQWVPEWAAVSNPCDIAGTCGKGICKLDASKTNASCSCLPGTSLTGGQCFDNLTLTTHCDRQSKNSSSQYKIATVPLTNYYYSESSTIANYSDIETSSKCGDACLSDCECVASVYGLKEETAYCWVLRSLEYGGFEDTDSTLYVKVGKNVSTGQGGRRTGDSSKESTSHRNKVLILPIVLCMSVLIGLLCSLLYYSFHRRRFIARAIKNALTVTGAPMNFSYRDLQIATSNFTQLLGTGGFGSVFKGNLGDGTLIAVKRLERFLPHGEKEFITEVNTIGSMHHMNLVRLCGFCSEGTHRLLVYEFMTNGSLDKWIFPCYGNKLIESRLLDWETRFHIAIATAQGIAYFHEQCRNRIIHCDIKPENILLDGNFCPKVSDFGLAKLMAREHSQVITMVRGTRGYLAPEWVSNRPITVKADVYSYGMLLLEIVGGRRNFDMSLDAEDFFYPGWAFQELKNGTPTRVADKRLMGLVNEDELTRALQVALWCIQDEVWMRPSMGEVVKMLEGSVDINPPPIPQTVSELVEEGLDHVYRAMKRDFTSCSYSVATHPSSLATCSYSTMSPR